MEEYWSIDIPGLTHERAVRLREDLLPESPLGVLLLDPSRTMVRGFDHASVRVMVECMRAGIASVGTQEDRVAALSMLEDFEDWLRRTEAD